MADRTPDGTGFMHDGDNTNPCYLCGWGPHRGIHGVPPGTEPTGPLGLHSFRSRGPKLEDVSGVASSDAPLIQGYRVDASYFQKWESIPVALRDRAVALYAHPSDVTATPVSATVDRVADTRGGTDCTEPNRAACPRKCIDFCNKAEQAAADARGDDAALTHALGVDSHGGRDA